MAERQRVLIVCAGNSARSQMAAGLLHTMAGDRYAVYGAGSAAEARVNPLTVRVMAEAGIDIAGARPTPLSAFAGQSFDLVLTLSESARRACAAFPGAGERLHWDVADPEPAGESAEEFLSVFRATRDDLRHRLTVLLDERASAEQHAE